MFFIPIAGTSSALVGTRFDLICRSKEGGFIYAKLSKSDRDLNLRCERLKN